MKKVVEFNNYEYLKNTLDEVLNEYYENVFSRHLKTLKSRYKFYSLEEIEDFLQDAIFKVYIKYGDMIVNLESFSGLVLTTAKNIIKDDIKHKNTKYISSISFTSYDSLENAEEFIGGKEDSILNNLSNFNQLDLYNFLIDNLFNFKGRNDLMVNILYDYIMEKTSIRQLSLKYGKSQPTVKKWVDEGLELIKSNIELTKSFFI